MLHILTSDFLPYFRYKYVVLSELFHNAKKYKFYLAFENSYHCNDYISEKFWRNSLGQGAVPIVYGPHPDDVKDSG